MTKQTAIVFGSSGGIGKAVVNKLCEQNYNVVSITRNEIDLSNSTADQQIIELLTSVQPALVVNAAGEYTLGIDSTHTDCFSINVGSNWSILRHYMKNIDQAVTIVMVGSSCYQSGRPLYPLYSSSKAAVYNLWQSAAEYFEGTKTNVHIINPVRVLTKMTKPYLKEGMDYLEPEDVAAKILEAILSKDSQCINMSYKEST